MSTKTTPVERLDRPTTETDTWPEQFDHHARLLKLREFYTTEELAQLLNRPSEEIERWMVASSQGSKKVHDDFNFLNRLDAAVDVTRAVAGRVGREGVKQAVFEKHERFDGRSLADMIAGPEYLTVGRVAERAFKPKAGPA